MNTLEATHIAQKQAHVLHLIKLLDALFSQIMSWTNVWDCPSQVHDTVFARPLWNTSWSSA